MTTYGTTPTMSVYDKWSNYTTTGSSSQYYYNNNTSPSWDYYHHYTEAPKHRKPPKEFNRFINASDLMEEFIKYCNEQNVRQDEMMQLPVELFIQWLVVRACEADQVEPPQEAVKALEAPKIVQPRCLGCQKYMQRGVQVQFHNADCATRYFERSAA